MPRRLLPPRKARRSSAGVEAARMSVAAACKYMRQELGDAYDPSTYAWLTERHGSAGVPDDVVKGLVAARRQAMSAKPAAGGLRAVGGA